MSQQGPGGYGGGGPYGPPGGGGYGGAPPGGGYPGAPPGGGGPPGGYPPGGSPPGGYPPGGYPPGYGPSGGGPPGYGPGPQAYGGTPPGGPPPKPSKALLWVGLGCGTLLLLSVAGGVLGYLFVKGKANDAESAILAAASAATAAASAAASGAPATGTCGKAQACCEVLAAKNGNAVLAKQACAAYGKLSDAVCAQQYAALKQTAVALGGRCE